MRIWPLAMFSVNSIWLIPAVGSWVMLPSTWYALYCRTSREKLCWMRIWTSLPELCMFTWEWDDYQEKEKKIGTLALGIGSNGCRFTSIVGNWKLNELERNEYTSIDPVDWIGSEQIEARLWDMFQPDPFGWQGIQTIKACVYLCRVYSLESYRCLR